MRDSTESAADEIDAAIFTGDQFHNAEYRKELREMMARWERGLKGFDDVVSEELDLMTEEEFIEHRKHPNLFVKLDSNTYKCENCGSNMFNHPTRDKNLYRCNGCRLEFKGE